jgi:hypothetical protein
MANELPHAVVRCLFLVFLTCGTCAAQSIAVGAIGGGRLTDDVLTFPPPEANSVTVGAAFRLESKFYDVGPTIEIGLAHGFAVEIDAVYHRLGLFFTFAHDTQYNVDRERDNSWEFPLLLKYKPRSAVVNPFFEAGVAPRTISGRYVGTFQSDGYVLSPPSPTGATTSYSPGVGFVAGGGLQFNLGQLRLAPQVRYTRWATAPVGGLYYSIGSTYSSNQNQLDVLVGISWNGLLGKLRAATK